MPSAPLFITVFAIALSEWALVVVWIATGIFAIHETTESTSAIHLLYEHRAGAFHFVAAIALLSAMERCKVLGRLKKSKDVNDAKTKIWSISKDTVYMGSWALAFITTCFTDADSMVALLRMPLEAKHMMLWKLEYAIVIWGLINTILGLSWSLAFCTARYATKRKFPMPIIKKTASSVLTYAPEHRHRIY